MASWVKWAWPRTMTWSTWRAGKPCSGASGGTQGQAPVARADLRAVAVDVEGVAHSTTQASSAGGARPQAWTQSMRSPPSWAAPAKSASRLSSRWRRE